MEKAPILLPGYKEQVKQRDVDHQYYLKQFASCLDTNKHLFLGNFRAGDNFGNFIKVLLEEAGE